MNAGSAYAFRPTAADADGDTLTFSIANKPTWATFSSASDGKTSVALAPFSITVADASNGAASLTWTVSATQLTQTIQVTNAGMSTYVVENLAPGTCYFAVRAYTSSGAESADSNVVAKVVQ